MFPGQALSWMVLFMKQDFQPSPHALPLLSIVNSNLLMDGTPFSPSLLITPNSFSPFSLALAFAIDKFRLNNTTSIGRSHVVAAWHQIQPCAG